MPQTTEQSQSSGAEGAQEKAKEAAGQAQEKAREAAGQARNRVADQLDQRSTDAGQKVSQTASDVRSVGEQLREQGKDGPAKIADQAAEKAEQAGRYLEQADGDRLLHDIEDFGRRQPWAVALGGLALGFAASRMLKASSSSRYESSRAGAPSFSNGSSHPSNGGGSFEPGASAKPSTGPAVDVPTGPTTGPAL